jgi:hypothetical protein
MRLPKSISFSVSLLRFTNERAMLPLDRTQDLFGQEKTRLCHFPLEKSNMMTFGIITAREIRSPHVHRPPLIERLEGRTLLSGGGGASTFSPAALATAGASCALHANVSASPSAASLAAPAAAVAAPKTLVNITLQPLDLNLLGLEIASSPITVKIQSQPGSGKLLGNLLDNLSRLVNLTALNGAVNSVLSASVGLANSGSLSVSGVSASTPLAAPVVGAAANSTVLTLSVPAVQLGAMGALVQISPIELSIRAHGGNGLVLGNALAALANAFNPPLPNQLNLDVLNAQVAQILIQLTQAIPGVTPAPLPASSSAPGDSPVVSAALPGLNLNLVGLMLHTDPVALNGAAQSGNGSFLGNVWTTLNNTQGATPDQLNALHANVNAVLARAIGALNGSSLTVSAGALNSLSRMLRFLAGPNLLAAPAGLTTGILKLSSGSSPVGVNLLGLNVTSNTLNAQLAAQTGDGQVLGNMLYNLANLTNPRSPALLLSFLAQMGFGASAATPAPHAATPSTAQLLSLTLPSLDLNLLGLEVQTSPINLKISAERGNGDFLGNLLSALSGLINSAGVSTAMNKALAATAGLVNSAGLSVPGISGSGPLITAPAATRPILTLTVPAVQDNALGAIVDVSPVTLTVTAHAGDGLVLGNALASLANLFDPPLPSQLDADTLNSRLTQLLGQLNESAPGINPAMTLPAPAATPGVSQLFSLGIPAFNVNLLGLGIGTDPLRIDATAASGDGDLLGNVFTTLENTLGATPAMLAQLTSNVTAVLAKAIGILNASSLTLPASALASLPPALQTLALPNLIPQTPAGSSASILDLSGGTLPNFNHLGLGTSSTPFHLSLSATTGDGQVLGNLLYNLSSLTNPGASRSLKRLLDQLSV